MTSKPLQLDLENMISSPRDGPASPGRRPGSSSARKMTAISGRKCADLLRLQGRSGFLEKMSEQLLRLQWASTVAFLIWKTSDTTHGHLLCQLSVSMPDTSETDFSSPPAAWPTPAHRDYRYPNKESYQSRSGTKKGEQLPNRIGGPLNPTFVEWLMGYPAGWTDCEVLGTASSLRSSHNLDAPSLEPAND